MKTIFGGAFLFAALALGLATGCDDDDNDMVEEEIEDSGAAPKTDAGTPSVACENADADFPGPYHCNYKTAFVQKNCYEYAKGVSRADAEADCGKHLQGGPGGLATNTRVFGEGPCALETTGYCFTAKQTPCGREFTVSTFKGAADCKPATNLSAAWGCEAMGNGEYVCTL